MPTTPTRRVTTADIARSLGVSRATVGFVLNDTPGQTISAATRERVLAEADRLGYRPHRAAQALASGHSRIVLLVLPDWPIAYSMSTHLDEASHALDEAGYTLVTWTPHQDGRARPLWETLQPDVVLSMVPLTPEQIAAIRRTGARTIDEADLAERPRYENGPTLQIEHLTGLGHRSLLFAAPADPRLSQLTAERVAQARRAADAAGATLADEIVDEGTVAAAVERWIAAGVTAVAAYNDDVAALVVGALLRAGRRVPGDLAVIGHDDAPIAALLVPSLSTIHVDTSGIGRYVAALALHLATGSALPAAGPETRASLVVRESTAR